MARTLPSLLLAGHARVPLTSAHPKAVMMLLSTYQAADLPADAGDCGAAAYVHKEEFGPALVRDVWARHSMA